MAEQRTKLNIIVGLGGTGASVLNKIYEKLEKLNVEEIKIPVGLLIFDSDENSKKNFPDSDFIFDTHYPNARDFCQKCLDDKTEFGKNFRQYWPGVIIDSSDRTSQLGYFSGMGFGQSRPKGFLGLLRNLQGPKSIIKNISTKATDLASYKRIEVNACTIMVYLVASFAGGTGSGSFLDLAYLIKNTLLNQNNAVYIHGIFLLGRTAMLGRGVETSEVSKLWANANTYGAYTELINRKIEGPNFKKYYSPEILVENVNFPFDSVMLFDYKNEKEKILDRYEAYENLLADILYDMVIRPESRGEFHTIFDDILAHGKWLGSGGRGVVLYPKKDILNLFSFYLLRDHIEKNIIVENNERIRTELDNDMRNLGLSLSPVDHLENKIRNLKYDTPFGIKKYPEFPLVIVKKIDRELNKRNCTEQIQEIRKILIIEIPNAFKEFKERTFKNMLDILKKEFKEKISQKGSISFIHGYLHNFKAYIENNKKYLSEIKESAESEYGVCLQDLDSFIKSPDKAVRNKKDFTYVVKRYFEALDKFHMYEIKYAIYEEFEKYFKKVLDSVNYVHNLLKKGSGEAENTGILHQLRRKINNLEMEMGDSNYPSSAGSFIVFSIKENIEYFKKIYNDFIKANAENFNNNLEKFEKEIIDYIFNEIFPKILEGRSIDINDLKIMDIIINSAIKNFSDIFMNQIPKDIFSAIAKYCSIKNLDPARYLKDIHIKMKDEVCAPFLTAGMATSQQDFAAPHQILGNVSKLQDFCIDNKIQLSNLEPFRISCDIPDLEDEIIYFITKFGYDENNLAEFNEPHGFYYMSYKMNIENLNPAKRYEVFVDLRYAPRALNKRIAFLMAEYANIIVNQLNNKGTETGIYLYRNDVLERNLRGRENVIKWFVETRDPEKYRNILNDLNEWWRNIPPADRQMHFQSALSRLSQRSQNRKLSENLRDLYRQDEETLKKAIEKNLFNINSF